MNESQRIGQARAFFEEAKARARNTGERIGQAAMNHLYDKRLDLHELVLRETFLDPFYNDRRMPAFRAFIFENW